MHVACRFDEPNGAGKQGTATVIGIILAGGRSTRMGQDKALLSWRGETWLDRARRGLAAAGAERTLVLGRPDLSDGLADPAPGRGPAVNLAALLSTIPGGTRLLVVPVDMPGLSPDLLRRLATLPAGGAPSGDVLPAALIVPDRPIGFTGSSLRALWTALGVPPIDLPGDVPPNLNTPDDIAAFEAEQRAWT